MNFIFQCSTQLEHEKIKFISTSGHVIFCLLHEHTNDNVFDNFPKISDHFPEDFRRFYKIVSKVRRTLPKICRRFSEDCRRFPKIFEKAPMISRSYSNTSKSFLRDYGTIARVIILVPMATPISSHVKDINSTFTACDGDMMF